MMLEPGWLKYAEFYPCYDEEGYDGEHDGGIKGLKEDAPEEAKREYLEYLKQKEQGIMP